MTEADDLPDSDAIDGLAEEYAGLCRRGLPPTVSDFAACHPEHAERLRTLLPAVALLERGKRAGRVSGSGLGDWSGRWSEGSPPPVLRLGENRVVRELGRGGMGIVYEAVQEPLGRRVAVKILPRHSHADSPSRRRFLREAQVVARLQHPHIVPIHAVGEQDGLAYFVMALIDGAGLDHLLANAPKAVPTEPIERARWVASLGLQAVEALAHAHDQGILHRDIKPANLLLDRSGTLWLADFGLAKLVDDLSLTGSGELPGTLRYLAPECLNAEADVRSDVYSLGLTLYELMAGVPAFPELDRVRLIYQVATGPVPDLGRVAPGTPRDLQTIVAKATARDPSARYPTAIALADDLRAFLDGRPIQGRRASPLAKLLGWRRRNPALAALGAIVLVLALTTALLLRLYLLAPYRPRPPLDDRPPPRDRPFPGDPDFGGPRPPRPPRRGG